MKFSLVTTCRNEIISLPRWKEDLLAQTRQPDEIVVVDAYSNDGTAEMLFGWAKNDSRVKVIQEKGAAAHGRNVAIEHSLYDPVLSTDMGVRLCPAWCAELVTPFEDDPEIDIVAGNSEIDKETVHCTSARAEYYINKNSRELILDLEFVPGNRSVAYRKAVWRELGGLPEDLTFYGDDAVFGRQMIQGGYKMVSAPKAMTYWGRPDNLSAFCNEQFNYGRGDGEASIKTPYSFKLYRKGYIPKWSMPILTGIRLTQKRLSLAGFGRALRAFDIPALLMMPVLIFCKGYSFGRGYLVGDEHGSIHCQACRERLKV